MKWISFPNSLTFTCRTKQVSSVVILHVSYAMLLSVGHESIMLFSKIGIRIIRNEKSRFSKKISCDKFTNIRIKGNTAANRWRSNASILAGVWFGGQWTGPNSISHWINFDLCWSFVLSGGENLLALRA